VIASSKKVRALLKPEGAGGRMHQTRQVLADRFEVDSLLGQGGMARVYRGTDRVLGRPVAIKVLADNLGCDPQFVARFRQEAQSAASVSHPNLVSVFDTGSDGDVHYIVMEYVEGRTLDETIRAEGPADPARALQIAKAVCGALAAAHARGIIHRDIKPANILLQPDGVVKVMDFGIAKGADSPSLTNAGFVVGTAAYLSPEQAQGLSVDPRSDIYSLGCVLYEMLTGVPPLAGETLFDIAHKLANEEPLPPSSLNPAVSENIDRIVMRALAKKPQARYQSALDMQVELEATYEVSVEGQAWGTQPESMAFTAGSSATTVIERDGTATGVLSQDAARPAPEGVRLGHPGSGRLLLVAGLVLLALAALLAFWTLAGRQRPEAGSSAQVAPPLEPPPPAATSGPPVPANAGLPAPEGPADSMVQDVIQGLAGGIVAAQNSGEITEKAARDVARELDKAYEQYSEGDLDDARDATAEAREELSKYYERGEVSSARVNSLSEALSRLEVALRE
jgi:predicted Ser/Thr protein kinase